MKIAKFLYLAIVFVFLFSSVLVESVSAHAGQPRLEITPESLNPGALLQIRGVDFAYEDKIVLSLIGPEIETPLAAVMSDVDGVFILTVTVPADLAEGPYFIRATSSDHEVNSATLNVWGVAVEEGGEQGPIDEEEGYGLLAPMPTVSVTESVQASKQELPIAGSTPAQNSSASLLWIVAGVGVILILALMRIRK